MPLRPRELIDSLTRAEVESIIKQNLRREVRKLNVSVDAAPGDRFDAIDSTGAQTVEDTPIILNLDAVGVNTNLAIFSLVADQLIVNSTGILDITISVALEGITNGEYQAEWKLRINGSTVARTVTPVGAGVI